MKTWEQLTAAAPAEILAWAEREPWARDMAQCQQDAMWHAEGDVWTHTKMVFEQAQRLVEWPELDGSERAKLLFTALFHDAGKAVTTSIDPESGRLRSPSMRFAAWRSRERRCANWIVI